MSFRLPDRSRIKIASQGESTLVSRTLHDGRCIRLSYTSASGYYAELSGERVLIESYSVGDELSDAHIVGDDHSPAGKQRRLKAWREENADAISQRKVHMKSK